MSIQPSQRQRNEYLPVGCVSNVYLVVFGCIQPCQCVTDADVVLLTSQKTQLTEQLRDSRTKELALVDSKSNLTAAEREPSTHASKSNMTRNATDAEGVTVEKISTTLDMAETETDRLIRTGKLTPFGTDISADIAATVNTQGSASFSAKTLEYRKQLREQRLETARGKSLRYACISAR